MIINHNLNALNSWRMNTMNQIAAQKSIQKLASGMRINQASDDAAGLAISERMRGQIRGLDQASRNIQDSISMIQTAEGGLQEIHSLLQRGRELSVQAANGTLTTSDRQSIQKEIDQITKEIDRIANTTEFNTIKLLNAVSGADSAEKTKAIEALQKSWLQQSEQLISTHYGLTADGATLEIVFVHDSGDDALAWVQGSYFIAGPDGRYFNQKLYIDMSDFTPVTWPNGGGSFISNDRIIAHEMVHAVMGRTTNFRDLPTWFKEGTAEFIHGADERLKGDIAAAGSIANLLSQASLSGGWIGDSKHYSTAYAAVKYLDSKVAGGIKTIMQDIKLANLGGNEKTLEQAIIDNTTYSSLNDFITDFEGANGAAFIASLDLNDADTGSIGGGDKDSVVPDIANLTTDPLTGFTEIWPTIIEGAASLHMQLGANSGQTMSVALVNVTSESLGLSNVDVVNQSGGSSPIDLFDRAIRYVSSERSRLGAMQNRLEHALAVTQNSQENLTASKSRIRDVDIAKEIMASTRANILLQAAQAILSQANQAPQGVLQLLHS